MKTDTRRALGPILREARLERGMTQRGVGEAMRMVGHAWSQQVVGTVERGERRLTIDEAVDLTSIDLLDLDEIIEPLPAAEILRLREVAAR